MFFAGILINQAVAEESGMDEMMDNMKKELDLSDKQVDQVQGQMVEFRGNVETILTKYEGEDEPDVGNMIGEIKDAQENYQNNVQGVLSPDQYAKYQEKVNDILTLMFNDLAEIRLMEAQQIVDLTDNQIAQLTPIVGGSTMKTVQVLFDNAGGRLTLPKKVGIAKKLKKIEKEKRSKMEAILTPSQLATYDKYQEEQKKKK